MKRENRVSVSLVQRMVGIEDLGRRWCFGHLLLMSSDVRAVLCHSDYCLELVVVLL